LDRHAHHDVTSVEPQKMVHLLYDIDASCFKCVRRKSLASSEKRALLQRLFLSTVTLPS
jgi:hypothetical protein